MNKPRKSKAGQQPDVVESRLERITLLAELSEEEIHPELFGEIEWMVDRGLEDKVYEVMESDDLSDEACDAIEFALEEAGYRLELFEWAEGAQSVEDATLMALIPFAITFVVPVSYEDARRLPSELKKAAKRISGEKRFRDLLGLDKSARVLVDARLYHVDHDEWWEESSVRRYLKGMAKVITASARRFSPLAADYKSPAEFSDEDMGSKQFFLVQRAVCGAVLVEEGEEAAELEDRMFDISEDDVEDNLDWISEILGEELKSRGIGFGVNPIVFPELVELWAVPSIAFRFQRMIEVRREIEIARERFIETAPTGRTIEPVLYISSHGEDYPEEIRLAAYPSDAVDEEPYFTYIWEIDHELETPEEVSDTIMEIASELNARITLVDGLLEDERCDDCNSKLFHGPGGPSHSVD